MGTHWLLRGSSSGSRAGGMASGLQCLQPARCPRERGAPKAGLGLLRWWFGCIPAALQRGWGGWGPEDSLKGCEGVVFSHCHCDGLGALVVEEVGCQAGKRGTGASEQAPAVRSLVLAPWGI